MNLGSAILSVMRAKSRRHIQVTDAERGEWRIHKVMHFVGQNWVRLLPFGVTTFIPRLTRDAGTGVSTRTRRKKHP